MKQHKIHKLQLDYKYIFLFSVGVIDLNGQRMPQGMPQRMPQMLKGTIHKGRPQNFRDFGPPPPLSAFLLDL